MLNGTSYLMHLKEQIISDDLVHRLSSRTNYEIVTVHGVNRILNTHSSLVKESQDSSTITLLCK